MKVASTPYDDVLYYQSPLQIGRFRLPLGARDFADTGPIENHLLVIPTWAIEISYLDHDPVVADPTKAMCYNRGCEYRRRALNPHGDLALWIAYEDGNLAEAIGSTPESPFHQRWVPLPEDAFLVARALLAEFDGGYAPDPVRVEDSAWWLLSRCLGNEHTMPKGTPRQRRAVARAEAFIAERYREPLTLNEIAGAAHVSPFHLSRLFHRFTGMRVHQRLVELRLRDALTEVLDGGRSLTEIAGKLGFSSPSHFSTAFRSLFGFPPSRLRNKSEMLPLLGVPASRTG